MPLRKLEDVVQAVKILVDLDHDVHYLIVGRTSEDPVYFRKLRSKIAACKLGNYVSFVGEIPEDALPDYYQACDAFVWASDENQSWGLACMEAMAAGKPVIVSRANGFADVLENGRTAILVDPHSPVEIAKGVIKLMRDPALAQSVAQTGQQMVSQNYTWRRNAEAMIALFEQAIAEARGRTG